MMKMAERLLLGDDVDVILLRVRDERTDVARRHRPAGRRREWIRVVAEALLEVG